MQIAIALSAGLEASLDQKAEEHSPHTKAIHCDCCHRAFDEVIGFAYLTVNDFLICKTCAENEEWQQEQLWLVCHLHEL